MMGCQNLTAYETWLRKHLVNFQISFSPVYRINKNLSLNNVNITIMIFIIKEILIETKC